MDKALEVVFLQELGGQCNFAVLALQDMSDNIDRLVAGDQSAGVRFWSSAQAMLTAVANLSRILFPQKTGDPKRGDHLQKLVGDKGTLPFAPGSRNMRNHYEHFDERIEQWWNNSPRKVRADYNFCATGALEAEFGATSCFRNYDASQGILTFMGEHFQILPMRKDIEELKERVFSLLTVGAAA